MTNQLGSLNPATIPQHGKHKVSLTASLELRKRPFVKPEETTQALAFDARQQDFFARMERHSPDRAVEDARKAALDYANGVTEELPPTADDMRQRYYNVVCTIRETAAEYTRTCGIRELCLTILQRAVPEVEARYSAMEAHDRAQAEFLEIPFEPSQSLLAVGRVLHDLHRRVRGLERPFEFDLSSFPLIRHLIAEFVDWPAAARSGRELLAPSTDGGAGQRWHGAKGLWSLVNLSRRLV